MDDGLRASVTLVGGALIRSLGEMEPLVAPGSGEQRSLSRMSTLVQCHFKHQVETTRWGSHCCSDTFVLRSVVSAHSFRYRLNHASGSGLALDDTSMQ